MRQPLPVRSVALLVFLLLSTLVLSGCFRAGCRIADIEWRDSTVWEEFPDPTTSGPYRVEYRSNVSGDLTRKVALASDAGDVHPSKTLFTITSHWDGRVVVFVKAHHEVPIAELWPGVDNAFSTLGIAKPIDHPGELRWFKEAC